MRCKLLCQQWQQAENTQPGAQATIHLLAQLQHTMSRKRRQYNSHQIMQFSKLLKSDPRKIWQKTRTPQPLLPAQPQTPAAWEPYLTHLTAPAPHSATHMGPPHQPRSPPAHSLNHPFTTEEIQRGLHHLNNGRYGALQGYTSEVLWYSQAIPTADNPTPPHLLNPCLQKLFNLAFSTGQVPAEWQTSLVTLIFKHGDADETSNYRPIAVGELLIRLYTSILSHRIVQYTKDHHLCSPTQTGFRPHLSTTYHDDQMMMMILCCNMLLTNNCILINLCTCALKAAYDVVQ